MYLQVINKQIQGRWICGIGSLFVVIFSLLGCGASKHFVIDSSKIVEPSNQIPLDIALYIPADCSKLMYQSNYGGDLVDYEGALGEALCPELKALVNRTFRSVSLVDNINPFPDGKYQAVLSVHLVRATRDAKTDNPWKILTTYILVDWIMSDAHGRIVWDSRILGTAKTTSGTVFTVKKNQLTGLKLASIDVLQRSGDSLRNSVEITKFVEAGLAEGPDWYTYNKVYNGRPLPPEDKECAALYHSHPEWDNEVWNNSTGIPLEYFRCVGTIYTLGKELHSSINNGRIYGDFPIPPRLRDWRLDKPFK